MASPWAAVDVMQRPPRNPGSMLLQTKRVSWAVLQGIVSLGLLTALLIYAVHLQTPEPQLRALMFTALVATNISLILVNRSFDASLLHAFSRRNPSLWILLSAVSALLVLLLNWDGARSLFHFDALNSWQWALCFGLAAANLVGLESLKQLWFARIWQSAR